MQRFSLPLRRKKRAVLIALAVAILCAVYYVTVPLQKGIYVSRTGPIVVNVVDNRGSLLETLSLEKQTEPDVTHASLVIGTASLGTGKNRTIDAVPVPTLETSTSEGNHVWDSSVGEKASRVRSMVQHAWKTYAVKAFGSNEYHSLSETPYEGSSLFGHGNSLGVFIVDSLDTLMLMGMDAERKRSIEWIRDHFNPKAVNGFVNVFEVTIRVLGGLLGALTLSNDQEEKEILLKASMSLADRLLRAFDERKSNLPHSRLNLHTGVTTHHSWLRSCIVLSEAGTLQLEMEYLSELSGNPKYSRAVRLAVKSLSDRFDGNNFVPLFAGQTYQCPQQISIGANGDSYYEYLLKVEILLNYTRNLTVFGKPSESFELFKNAMNKIEELTLDDSNPNATYFAEINRGRREDSVGHLFCFTGGLYGLARMHNISADAEQLQRYERLARNLTYTCRQSYVLGKGLGPEQFRVNSETGTVHKSHSSVYILRPEYAESLFYLYRLTGDPIYREWGWEMVEQLERRCKVKGGYTTLNDVFKDDLGDDQPTYFIAETLKYLYLLFTDKLDPKMFVFNTEAHPFRIIRQN